MSKENLNNLSFGILVILIILFSLILLATSLKPFSLEKLSETLNETYYFLYNNVFNQIILGLIAIIIFSLGIYLIQKRKLLNTLSSSVTQKTSFGEIKISLNSINHLIYKVLIKMESIKESKSNINVLKSGGINVDLHLVLKQDVNIPEISETIQSELKDFLLKTSGIELKEIKIFIDKVFYEDQKLTENKST